MKNLKKKIEQLLSGKFEYEQPQLLFSQEKLSIVLKAGETKKGELYFGTEDNQKIRGYITSSDRRFVPGFDRFSGTTVCLPYGVDGSGMEQGDSTKGWLCFTTNIGEYKLPFEITIEKEQVQSTEGAIRNIDEFSEIAKEDFREAYRLFTDKNFGFILREESKEVQALYKGMSRQPVTYQHLEEFLVSTGKKEKISISLKKEKEEFYEVCQSAKESFTIIRSGWGHLRLDVETEGEFLETEKKVITEEDFIGSFYELDYLIRKEKLGRGIQYGEIRIRSPYQELRYTIAASRTGKAQVNVRTGEKKERLKLMEDYLSWRCGKKETNTWLRESLENLGSLKEKGLDYPEYQIYEAYLLHLDNRDEEAKEILVKYQDKSFTKEDLELAGIFLYVCTLTGLYKDKMQALRKVQNFYMQKGDSFWLLCVLQKMDPEIKTSPSKSLFLMEEQFERGCKNPLLYLEAWECISKDMTLLHRLTGFWTQVFLFAGKRGILTEELTMRFAYLSGYEKSYNESMYRALAMGCDAFPSQDTLEAVCKYIMKGNPRRQEYFKWFSMAVEQGLRLTRLYEYYVETMDTSYQRELPKQLLMYFTYNNNNLGDARKAFIYAGVTANKEREPQTFESYRENMETFAAQKLREGRINENYAVLYQEFLSEPKTREEGKLLAARMFTNRLYCDDKKIRSVIVRHSQLGREEVYPLSQGVAYPRIYTEDAVILFQDEKQRRYCSTVDYNLKKLMDEREMLPAVLHCGVSEPGVLLHYCEHNEITKENLSVFLKLVENEAFAKDYIQAVRKKILDYYAEHIHGEDLDDYLRNMDFRAYAAVDKKTLMETLIARRFFPQAMGIVEEFGFEGLDKGDLLKLTSRMILRCDGAEDEELLSLSSEVYRSGIYDEVILQYLMKYRFGPVEELLSIWKSAKGFDMDTYELEEKILSLLMFTTDYRKEGEAVLEAYVRHTGKERIIGSYLTQVAYGIFVKEYPMSEFVYRCLENAYIKKWPVNRVCHLALFLGLSREKKQEGQIVEMEQELLKECMRDDMTFAFFRRLSPSLLGPYQLDDKTFVEYHAAPEDEVTLFYAIDTGLGGELKYKREPLRNAYEGICTKTFTLFYGEMLHYYFQVETNGETRKTQERVLNMNGTEGIPVSKYQMINQILSARRLDKEREVLSKLMQYQRQERYVKEMFQIDKDV